MRILVIDDEAEVREITKELLRFLGHEVITAECGEAGIKLVQSGLPDLVITDLNMPRMNGIQVIESTRLASKTVPIILYSGNSENWQEQGLRAGANATLSKPYTINEMRSAIKIAMESRFAAVV